jgi:hypothetical protein
MVDHPEHLFLMNDCIVTHNTHVAAQAAQALGLSFGMISGSAGTTESEIFGTAIPNISTGENIYVQSDFVRIYEGGGLFLIDESDAMDPNCFLKLNAALANGYCHVPKRYHQPMAKKHKDFCCMAAANTWGAGATRQYCGRNKLDEATLDRFRGGSVPMDYDEGIETRWACPDLELYSVLKGWRDKIMDQGFQRILSTRFMNQAHKLKQLGYDERGIAQKLVGGWSKKEVLAVIGYDPDKECS